ncbi:Importin subunit alpha [Hondaea fermentalgiana]|uniref:Importin subunit alpha n=1 Tax=Hondaea fermentalgiana TaxID=2315210 RepID=A0A2R5G3T7_9STRA|nr:Importin subunit alpha [Hondaea fermentalgiana]|eukprot:GBG25682.1 Importin subunit alpha [Hondaea fermentalgiana]
MSAAAALVVVVVVAATLVAEHPARAQSVREGGHVLAWDLLAAHEAPQTHELHARRLGDIAEVGDYVSIHVDDLFGHLAETRNGTSRLAFPMPTSTGASMNTTVLCELQESYLAMSPQLAAEFPTVHSWRGLCDDGSVIELSGEEGAEDSVAIFLQRNETADTIYVDSAVPASSTYLMYSTRKARLVDTKLENSVPTCGVNDSHTLADPDYLAIMNETDDSQIPSIITPILSSKTGSSGASTATRATNVATSAATVGRKLRLALIANKEYSNYSGGTIASTFAAMLKIISRVNNVYMREMGIYFELIDQTKKLICAGKQLDSTCTAYMPNTSAALYKNAGFLSRRNIDKSDYDIGHSFTTGSGGIAGLGVVCGSDKAWGTTGLAYPTGDIFAIDYVAHEMGHQMGMNHVFRDCNGGNGQRVRSAAVEPGSGSTIMSYAGLCSNTNARTSALPIFNPKSIEVARKLINKKSCGSEISTSRSSPIVSVPATCDVPVGQSFVLEGASETTDGSSFFQWTRVDNGAESYVDESVGRFAPWEPIVSKIRYFPNLYFTLNSVSSLLEILPSSTQTMTFRFHERALYDEDGTVDDFAKAVIGDYGFADTEVSFVNANPLSITSSGTFSQGLQYTFKWDNGGTKSLSADVGIYMALDELPQKKINRFDYSDDIVDPDWVLVATVANTGSATATVPTTIHSANSKKNGLLMIRSTGTEGCAFFDIKRIKIAKIAASAGDPDETDETEENTEEGDEGLEECYERRVREKVKKANKLQYKSRVKTVQACIDLCIEKEECNIFNYHAGRNACWLLSHSIRTITNVNKRPYALSDDLLRPPTGTRRPSALAAGQAGEDDEDDTALWEAVAMLQTEDADEHLEGARGLRELLSRPDTPPISLVVQSGVVPRLVELIERTEAPEELVYEILWALSNVASSTSTMTEAVVDALAVPAVVRILLNDPSERVFEQAIWCISNICGDSLIHRDLVYSSFPMQAFLTTLSSASTRSGLRVSVWFLANFLRFKPYPFSTHDFSPVLEALGDLVESRDTDVFTDTCWALNYVMAGPEPEAGVWAEAVLVSSDAVPRLLLRLDHLDHAHELEAALGVLCKAARSPAMSPPLQDAILSALPPVLRHAREAFRRCACLTVLNIAKHDPALVRSSDVLGACFELLEDDSNGIDQVAVDLLEVVVQEADRIDLVDLAERGALEGLATYLQKIATMCVIQEDRDSGSTGTAPATNSDQEQADYEAQALLPLELIQVFLSHDDRKISVLGARGFREACVILGIPLAIQTLARIGEGQPVSEKSAAVVLAESLARFFESP